MVDSNHPIPTALQKPGKGIPQESGADMTNMHGLGNIGGTEIYDDCFWVSRRSDPKVFVLP
jgi:hypothetical protein